MYIHLIGYTKSLWRKSSDQQNVGEMKLLHLSISPTPFDVYMEAGFP
jgi:hypothetical protein